MRKEKIIFIESILYPMHYPKAFFTFIFLFLTTTLPALLLMRKLKL